MFALLHGGARASPRCVHSACMRQVSTVWRFGHNGGHVTLPLVSRVVSAQRPRPSVVMARTAGYGWGHTCAMPHTRRAVKRHPWRSLSRVHVLFAAWHAAAQHRTSKQHAPGATGRRRFACAHSSWDPVTLHEQWTRIYPSGAFCLGRGLASQV